MNMYIHTYKWVSLHEKHMAKAGRVGHSSPELHWCNSRIRTPESTVLHKEKISSQCSIVTTSSHSSIKSHRSHFNKTTIHCLALPSTTPLYIWIYMCCKPDC